MRMWNKKNLSLKQVENVFQNESPFAFLSFLGINFTKNSNVCQILNANGFILTCYTIQGIILKYQSIKIYSNVEF